MNNCNNTTANGNTTPDQKWRIPATSVKRNDDTGAIGVRVELPGIAKTDVKVKAVEDQLHVSAETGKRKFKKTFYFRKNVDADKTEANYNDGLLKIVLTPVEPVKAEIAVA